MGLFRRAASIASVPAGAGAKLVTERIKNAGGALGESQRDRIAEETIANLTRVLGTARGPMLKFGQALALYADAVPEPLSSQLRELNTLYDQATPLKGAKAAKLLNTVPEEFIVNPEAVAAASLGQVHYGWAHDGTKIAVKLRYPDAHRIVAADMAQLRLLVPLLGKLLPELDLRALLDTHRKALERELDYRFEASWQMRFREAWQSEGVIIPRVIEATENMLVSEWVDGDPLEHVRRTGSQADRDALATALLRFTLCSPLRLGAVHADPHPGNFKLLEGRLVALDFGSVETEAGGFTRMFVETSRALETGDAELLKSVWVKNGFVAETTPAEQLVELLGGFRSPSPTGITRVDKEWLTGGTNGDTSMDFFDVGQMTGRVKNLRFPPSFLLEHRAVMGTLAMASSLNADVPFDSILLEAIRDSAEPADGL